MFANFHLRFSIENIPYVNFLHSSTVGWDLRTNPHRTLLLGQFNDETKYGFIIIINVNRQRV